MKETIAFVGGGNMGASLIGGLIAAGIGRARMRVAEPDAARAASLHGRFGVTVAPLAADIAPGAGVVVLAVKPQVMAQAIGNLRLPTGCTVISIAAGVRLDFLRRHLGADVHYVRAMPNTPALVRAGVTALYAPAETPSHPRALAEAVLGAVGKTCWVEREELLDAVTALSGSGPAYFFLVVEALREAGAALGLDRETAALLARKTLIGAARMLDNLELDAAALRAQVTSKGGTTEAALARLESGGLRRLFESALQAAAQRAHELGDELDAHPTPHASRLTQNP